MATSTVILRDKLHQFIDTVDEKKVQAMYVMFEEEIETTNLKLSDKEIEALDIQRENYLAGKSKTYNWEEVETELMVSIKK
ncbi:MAG: hypothetical protein H6553_12140 [Chitinophagales bacterium]|nr:hypothetical protein [Chitinophagales bacterium]